ncbi:hypothetical protein BJ742DRAFT_816905 [Cladochytrium replicatum]|nr:hypothetical protein BJ742DRAFT_816905 [Cladochytrium replicatum]
MHICMVSDFFYPNFGGLEAHVFQLSSQLVRLGHKLIIVTHSYGDRKGVRYLTRGIKAYYLPHWVIHEQASLPTLYSLIPLFRYIFIRESIDIVHGHGAFSSMCHEAILCARTMQLRAVFTDHSLFGFEDVNSILTNKLLKFTLSDIDHVICVSHTSKENTVLRAALDPAIVSVIPNAVVASDFLPDPSARNPDKITIVYAGRLAYRRGADLMLQLIPYICERHPNVQFIIAGDGQKRVDFEQMREIYLLQDRVTMLGAVKHSEVREKLFIKGDIYLNTSLTEAFCISIVEAACCGLLVVSTKVGGIPEVLPDHMIQFAEPTPGDLIKAVEKAIEKVETDPVDANSFHGQIQEMYSWSDVALRTQKVYERVMEQRPRTLLERLQLYYRCGPVAGKLGCMIMAFMHMLIWFLERIVPTSTIDLAPWLKPTDISAICDTQLPLSLHSHQPPDQV